MSGPQLMRRLRQMIARLVDRLGYEITRKPGPARDEGYGWRVVAVDGDYREIQTAGNRAKLDWVWAQQGNIDFVADYLMRTLPKPPTFGLCHGTRRGLEQQWFRDALGCEVLGTEISDTADAFPNTIRWDFHDTKPEWLGSCDFVYSNSWDHSPDPERMLNAWTSCLAPHGVCILEHSPAHGPSGTSDLDPFGARLEVLPYLIARWGQGRWAVRELLDAPLPAPHDSARPGPITMVIVHRVG